MRKVQKTPLRQLRELKGYTQEELASKAGITARTLNLYESDTGNLRKAKYETVKNLSAILGVTVDDIFLDDISDFLKLPGMV
ncbi:helix-turn-helix transcriptional regulator [Streptococcus danieliae]|uniref:helix-turn-helix transcriptional regulator n=1 Tax=Streptococcus danieliae TaxID=747656 RepID=UPI0021CA5984|nr:helix-turn-helix transcriptional regulator [Streptococcus danieliae]MCU0082237.1 helix-turn-helix domain-containing protein [Streptococcus danieliae]